MNLEQREIELKIKKIKLDIKLKEAEIAGLHLERIKEEQKFWIAISKQNLLKLLREKEITSRDSAIYILTDRDYINMNTSFSTYVYLKEDRELIVGGYGGSIEGDNFTENDRFLGKNVAFIRKDLKKYP